MRPTIKDIAKKTGLSITTVSLILNHKGDKFPQKTRQAVFKAVKALNYRPNQLAISLLTRQSRTMGLIIPDICNMFFSELAKGVEDRCRQEQYNVILCSSNDEFLLEQQCITTLYDRGVDGIVIVMSAESFGPKNEECLAALGALRLPVILADCFNDTSAFSVVAIDNREGSCLAIRYLLGLGHRRIGCITGPLGITTNRDRLAGYTGCLAGANSTADNALVYEGDFRYQSGYDGALCLMKQKEKAPTALFCHNDMMAFGAAKGLRDLGLRIPQDVSLVGFDDIFFSQYMDVPLTTIAQPVYEMGFEACTVLLEEIAGKSHARQRRIHSPRLVIRQSAAPPPFMRLPGASSGVLNQTFE